MKIILRIIPFCIALVSCGEMANETDLPEPTFTIEINGGNDLIMERENTYAVNYEITPIDQEGNLGELTWRSFNEDVLKVDSYGLLTSIQPGNTKLALTNENNTIGDTINVTVTPKLLNSYTVENGKENIIVAQGKDYKMKVDFDPIDADDKTLEWKIYRYSDTQSTINEEGVLNIVGINPFTVCVRHSMVTTNGSNFDCARSLGVIVLPSNLKITSSGTYSYNTFTKENSVSLKIGSIDYEFTLKSVRLYKTSGFTFNKEALIKEKAYDITVDAGEVKELELFEITNEVASELSYGCLLSCVVSIDGKDIALEIIRGNEKVRTIEQI
ncbi:MAG: hypothetical protein ACPH2K_01370 [Flavicella sp.]